MEVNKDMLEHCGSAEDIVPFSDRVEASLSDFEGARTIDGISLEQPKKRRSGAKQLTELRKSMERVEKVLGQCRSQGLKAPPKFPQKINNYWAVMRSEDLGSAERMLK